MSALPKRRLSEEEYLTIERAAEYKSEYIDGEMYAMAGAGLRHTKILLSFGAELHAQFRGRPCSAFVNDLRVRVADSGLYTYPDVLALCGEPRLLDHHTDTLLNPQLIVEVLSPSTENYDRGEKFRRYRQLESLTDYVLVAQNQMLVEHWSRQATDLWKVREFNQPADRLRFESLAAEVVLSDVYDGVDLSAETPANLR
jgi:Uma2 family endonuclease